MGISLVSKLSRLLLFVLIIPSFVTGCASTGGMENVSQESLQNKDPHQSLVLGRLIIRDKGTFWESGGSGKSTHVDYTRISFEMSPEGVPDSIKIPHDIDAEGYFSLILEPGEYRLARVYADITQYLVFIPGNSWSFRIPTPISFEVPSGRSVYIGSILLEYKINDKWRDPSIEHETFVMDEYQEDMEALREKYHFLPKKVENASNRTQKLNNNMNSNVFLYKKPTTVYIQHYNVPK